MKKILFLLHTNPPIHGSAVIGASIKNSELINNSFDCNFVNLLVSKDVKETSKITFIKYLRFIKIWFNTLYALLLKKPDLCYFALTCSGPAFYKDVFLVALIKIFRVKIVYHLHNKGFSSESNKKINNLLYRYVFHNTETILLSKLLYPDIKKYVSENKIHICPNGIEKTNININILNKNINNSNPIQLLFLSNLIISKGIFVLLDACKLLKEKEYNFKCTIIGGEGDLSIKNLIDKIESMGLTNFISVVGKKVGKEKSSYFENADIFVFPTFYNNETFGLVNLEAMQYSLPIITTYEGGIPDVVNNGYNGFLIEKNNSEALAEKIEELIKNPELRIQFGNTGRMKFLNEFTYDIFENKLKTILEKTHIKVVNRKILFLSPLPPPFYGSAISSEMCLNLLRGQNEYLLKNIKLNYSLEFNDMEKFNFRKIVGFFKVIFLILSNCLKFRPNLTYIMPATNGISFFRDITFALIVRLFPTKRLFHIRTQIPDLNNQKIKKFLFKLAFSGGSAIILGNELKSNISEFFPDKRIYILPNALEATISNEKYLSIKNARALNSKLNLIFISNMMKSKGWLIALEAAKILKELKVDFSFKFAGSWPSINEELEFTNYVNNNKLTKNVMYVGFINKEQKHNLLSESDILIFPTSYNLETFGRVIIEAMEYGIPVIANGIATIPSIINHNESGYVLHNNSASEIVENVMKLKDETVRNKMGELARIRFLDNYTIKTYKEGLLNIISEC